MISVERKTKKLWDGKNDMTIGDTREQTASDEIYPPLCVRFGTGQTERTLTGEGDPAGLTAPEATVLGEAHLIGVAAVKHLLNHSVVIVGVIFGMDSLEVSPVVTEYLLERALVNVLHSRPFGQL